METVKKAILTIQTQVNARVEKVWDYWTTPEHIIRWNYASDDWHSPKAENDLRVGGRFLSRMEAKNGSWGFDFTGSYTKIEKNKQIDYTIDDGRKVQITFDSDNNKTLVTEIFEAEETNSPEMQQAGWQAILNNFGKYVESLHKFEKIHAEVFIKANVHKVFQTMFDDKKYKEWASEFDKTSHFIGTWEKGTKMLFLGTDHEGKKGGVVSKILENIPDKFVSIEHLGLYKGDKEILSGNEIDDFAGSLENYTFSDSNGNTLLSVDMDSSADFKTYFLETWPKALNKLKTICEKQ